MIIVHYEVYVLEGRGWMLHARFPRSERDTAIAEAKELEQTLKIKVKVIRETYYPDDNSFEEAEVYISGGTRPEPLKSKGAAAPAAVAAAAGRRGTGKPAPGPAARPPPARRRKAPGSDDTAKLRQILIRLMGICALSLSLSMLALKATPEVIVLLWKMGFSITVSPDGYNQLLIVVFFLTFLMTAVPLGMKFIPRQAQVPVFHKPNLSWGRAAARQTAVKESLDKLAAEAMRSPPAEEPAPPPAEAPPIEAPPIEAPPVEVPSAGPVPDEMPLPPDSALPAFEADVDTAVGQTERALAPAVSRYSEGALDYCRANRIEMDAYNRFALHLYLAGAVEALGELRMLGGAGRRRLLAQSLERLGTRGETAESFHDKLPDYLREPRYQSVAQAGRDAMSNFLRGDEDGAHLGLRDVFVQWNRKSGEAKPQMMTVLFTDMVGSTDMTQARGDAAAQEIVRRHNLIVRGALSRFGGKEVKHTGDGIMASFLSAAGAIDAVILMQSQVSEHNRRMPDQELHLRIGLNAGEPIQEEDDLFGSTVQLAARVCAATNTDEILCTASVVALSGRPQAGFRPVGAKHMKGFKDAIPLFEIPWR